MSGVEWLAMWEYSPDSHLAVLYCVAVAELWIYNNLALRQILRIWAAPLFLLSPRLCGKLRKVWVNFIGAGARHHSGCHFAFEPRTEWPPPAGDRLKLRIKVSSGFIQLFKLIVAGSWQRLPCTKFVFTQYFVGLKGESQRKINTLVFLIAPSRAPSSEPSHVCTRVGEGEGPGCVRECVWRPDCLWLGLAPDFYLSLFLLVGKSE